MTTDVAWAWPTLHDAQRAVLLEMLVHGDRSRAELARRTGLSRASLTRLSRDLVEFDLVEEGETAAPLGRGRPGERLRLRAGAAQFVGVKLTGDTLYAVVTDLSGTVLATEEHELASPAVADVVDLIGDVVDSQRVQHRQLAAVGVCLAGDVRYRAGRAEMIESYFLGWADVPLELLVSERTGLPTAISNDVQALTAAHHWFGAGRGQHSMVLIGLGAGIGAGIVMDDEPVRGARGHPGKIGHLPVSDTGPRCDHGHVGCASAYVTIPAITKAAGTDSLTETLAAATAGDLRAHEALLAAARALGAVVAYLVNVLDPGTVIVTGEGRVVAEYGREALRAEQSRRLDPDAEPMEVAVQPFRFADYAWGAAITAIRQLI